MVSQKSLLEPSLSQNVAYLEFAEKILDEAKTGMHVRDIAITMLDKHLSIKVPLEEVVKKVNYVLSSAVNKKDSRFSKVENGKKNSEGKPIYKKGFYKTKRKINKPIEPTFEVAEITEDTGFIGKAGEYAVMSELLFRGFNVSLMTVDKGIDIVAANETGRYFHIQVKTSNEKNGQYYFSVRRKSFDSNNNSQTYYVFVMRNKSKCDYLILPNTIIANLIALDVVKGVDSLGFTIVYDSKTRRYTLNKRQDITIHVGGFGQIN